MAKFLFIEWLIDWLEQQKSFKFEWDDGNTNKSKAKHGVTCDEAESVFSNKEAILALGEQVSPKVNETRYGVYGLTITGRLVFLCFTLRKSKIRIISVRE